jgi:enhancing lycopene biosynthesis protein 2
MRRVGVLLAGCGVYDGSDVQETVLLALALRKRGLKALFLAPDVEQRDVADHTTGNVVEGAPPRRVLEEAARLTRGVAQSIEAVSAAELDALAIPGGIGVVKNLCLPGAGLFGDGPLRPEIAAYLDALRERKAALAAIGLGEVVLARHQGRSLSPEAVGMPATEVRVDEEKRTVFTPGFMGSSDVAEVAAGVERLVDELARMVGMPKGLVIK